MFKINNKKTQNEVNDVVLVFLLLTLNLSEVVLVFFLLPLNIFHTFF